jgi:hypothetical protein
MSKFQKTIGGILPAAGHEASSKAVAETCHRASLTVPTAPRILPTLAKEIIIFLAGSLSK